ncbi:MAG: prepilin peptidase, partial [Clostridia bacterium]
LAVYRIPRGEDITHTRSYCPHCNHKFSFWDMIPLFSYIFLRGRCRYCKEKIRPRYFILELCSGLVFVLFALSIKLGLQNLNASIITYFIFGLLYIAGLFIVSGIDNEKKQIQNELVLYLIIVESLYIIYLCIVEIANIYRYVIYLVLLVVLTTINILYYKKKLKNNYTIDCLILLTLMVIFTYEYCSVLTVIFTLLAIAITLLFDKIKEKRIKYVKKTTKETIPIGFYLCVTNIIVLIATNFLIFYR